jgi:excisionase family DNA binding protein
MPNDSEPSLLTVEEVAKQLRLKPSTVYEAAADGRIPCVKLWKGRRKSVVRFRRHDIEKFIVEHAVCIKTAEVK